VIVLDATTKSLELKLGEAHTTSASPVVTSYVDVTTTAYTPGVATNNSNGTSVVTVVSAPASSTQRQLKFLSCYNADTVSHVVTVQYNNNSTTYVIIKVTLAAGYTLLYTDGEGWRVLDTSGNLVQSANSTLHATTHKSGGTDAIKLDELAAPTDVTTLNSTTSAHGLLKKLSNSATQYMDGSGNWSTPTGTGKLIARYYASYASNADLTTTIPADNTIPQNTEGTEILSVTLTPTDTNNTLRFRFQGWGAMSALGAYIIAALFQDSTADALCASAGPDPRAATGTTDVTLEYEMTAGTASSTTFKIRVGPQTAATLRLNGLNTGRYFGGVSVSTLIVEELIP
jgi:hypothetical protein